MCQLKGFYTNKTFKKFYACTSKKNHQKIMNTTGEPNNFLLKIYYSYK